MPRKSREFSKTDVYHIIQKGVDNQDIFYDDKDKKEFLNILMEVKIKYKFKIIAYCLMSNHIHLVLKIDKYFLSKVMKIISMQYVAHFNKKYKRSGHLFQNRFNSKCVENKKYFLDVCRYIEQNPEKAKICDVESYKWSSYHEYIGEKSIVDKELLLHYFDNNIENYRFFTTKGKCDDIEDFIEYELKSKMEDNELSNIIIKEFNLSNINEFKSMPKEELQKGIEFLSNMKYTNFNQISRVIRINRYRLEKYLKRGE